MNVRYPNARSGADRHSDAFRALLASGMWLRAGFVALSIEAITLIMLATGEASPWAAIIVAIVAGVTARWSWRRARSILNVQTAEKDDGGSSAVPLEPRARRLGGRVGIALSR